MKHGREGFLIGILLADGRQLRNTDHKVLLGMPVFHEADSRPSPRTPDNPHYMVVHRVGPGPSKTFQEGT
jgi:hypothetical protein